MDPLCCIAHCYVQPVSGLQIFGVAGLPEIAQGADLAALIERITRSLAFMLRHQPETFDLELDPHGYRSPSG
jgi:hypothetical protein